MELQQKFWTWIIGIYSIAIGFFSPLQLLLYAIITTVLLDTFTAILKEWVQIYKLKTTYIKRIRLYFHCIKSSGIRRTFLKLTLYCLGLMSFYLAEVSIFTTSVYISNLIGALILFTELKSICENVDIALGTDIFTKFLKIFRKKVIQKLDGKISDKE